MTPPPHGLKRGPAFLIATCFGIGFLPKAPGTWGSLAALPFAWVIVHFGGWPALLAAILIVFLAGWWASAKLSASSGILDPGFVVVDEVAGQWLVLAAAPLDPVYYGAGFLLFRLFDIWKPWPANWADRTIKGGLGIMADDILAGIYGLVILAAVSHLTGHR